MPIKMRFTTDGRRGGYAHGGGGLVGGGPADWAAAGLTGAGPDANGG